MPPAAPVRSRLGGGTGPVKRRQLEPWEVADAGGAARALTGTGSGYSIEQVNSLLADKADVGHAHPGVYQPASQQLSSLAILPLEGSAGKRIIVNDTESGFVLEDVPAIPAEKHWIKITATGTGASQDITLYEAVEQDGIFLSSDGIMETPGDDFTVSGTTLTGTFANAAAIVVRYLGTVDGDIPVNSAAPVISGSADVGQTLTVATPGTWSGSPALTYLWLRDGIAITGETGADFLVTTGADIGADISVREIATNGFGSAFEESNAIGPITAAPDLTAPVATRTSADGAALAADVTMAADIYAGFYLRVQRTATGSGAAGDYTTPTLDITHPLTASEVATGTVTNADLANDGYFDAAGEYWQRYRWEREDGVVSPWSNQLHDIVTASVAKLSATDKSSNTTVSADGLTVGNTTNGGSGAAKATISAAGSKLHMEIEVLSIDSSKSTYVFFGIAENGFTLSPSLTQFPGNTGSTAPGFTLRIDSTASPFLMRNAGIVNTGLGASVAGDKYAVEYDSVTRQVTVKKNRGGTITSFGPVTLTTAVPLTIRAFAGTNNTSNSARANFGAAAFAITPTAGFSQYA